MNPTFYHVPTRGHRPTRGRWRQSLHRQRALHFIKKALHSTQREKPVRVRRQHNRHQSKESQFCQMSSPTFYHVPPRFVTECRALCGGLYTAGLFWYSPTFYHVPPRFVTECRALCGGLYTAGLFWYSPTFYHVPPIQGRCRLSLHMTRALKQINTTLHSTRRAVSTRDRCQEIRRSSSTN